MMQANFAIAPIFQDEWNRCGTKFFILFFGTCIIRRTTAGLLLGLGTGGGAYLFFGVLDVVAICCLSRTSPASTSSLHGSQGLTSRFCVFLLAYSTHNGWTDCIIAS